MKAVRRALAVAAVASLAVLAQAGAAFAQTSIQVTVTPVRTDGGWVYWLAFLSLALALLLAIFLIAMYMRYAPRFAKDEDEAKVVRADRVLPGRTPPRRMVDVTQAVPVVAAPPPVVAATAPAAAPAAEAPAPAAAAAPAPAAPAAEAPAAGAPVTEAPAAEAPAPAAPAAAAAPAAPAEHADVSLDQEVFDKTLEELLASGTDRRIAEGKAKRAAMIAARKKAAGG